VGADGVGTSPIVSAERASEVRHVYVHVPFCARRCSYCDFAIAVRRVTPVREFLHSLERELEIRLGRDSRGEETAADRSHEEGGVARASRRAERQPLDTLYFGGGTPSRLGGDGIARLMQLMRGYFDLARDAEVTIEANPDDVTAGVVAEWVDAGVNRLSLGVQSFDARVLAWMHRTHDVESVFTAVDHLRSGGLENWSLDLIYALPVEVPRDWERDVELALALAPRHLSAYGLTFEGGTPLGKWRARGDVHDAPEERFEAEFLHAHHRLARAGFRHYEVSNWGLPGHESRHNSSYWRGVPYLGFGPGAHGFDGQQRRWNQRELTTWQSSVARGEDPMAGGEHLTRDQREAEALYVGLRTLQGVQLRASEVDLVAPWVRAGWGTIHDGRLVLSSMGWLRLDALVVSLTEHRSRY